MKKNDVYSEPRWKLIKKLDISTICKNVVK